MLFVSVLAAYLMSSCFDICPANSKLAGNTRIKKNNNIVGGEFSLNDCYDQCGSHKALIYEIAH